MKIKRNTICGLLLCAMTAALLAGCGGGTSGGGASAFSAAIEGQQVVCDVDVADFLKAFGDGYEYSEAISCAYDGMDKIYMYPDFNLYTYPQGEKDFVSEIELLSDRYATGKGIRIGSTRDEMTAAYGEKFVKEGVMIVYYEGEEGASTSVCFYLEDDAVAEISITSKVAREG